MTLHKKYIDYPKGQAIMENPETQAMMGTGYSTKTNETKSKTKKKLIIGGEV